MIQVSEFLQYSQNFRIEKIKSKIYYKKSKKLHSNISTFQINIKSFLIRFNQVFL